MTSPSRRLASLLSLGALALGATACSEEVPDRDPTPVSNESEATDPAESPTDTPTESESPEAEGTVAVPVYFVGDTPQGPRLFREFRAVPADNPLMEATALMLAGDTLDPDYRTLWPQVEISDVSATDGVLLVQIPSDGFTERPDGMSRKAANLALQQLVFTLQGVQQERAPIVIKRGGSDFRLFGLPTDVELTAASALRTLNLVNITSPAEGDTVTGDTLTVTGVSNSFEASGPCRLIAGDEEITLEAYQAEGWMEDRLFPFEVELSLADVGTGDVLVQCETDDPSGGAEGNGPAIDTKLITVH